MSNLKDRQKKKLKKKNDQNFSNLWDDVKLSQERSEFGVRRNILKNNG